MTPHSAAPGGTRVGWIGTGVMGVSMARHLLAAGYDLTVYSRTMAKAAPLVEVGAATAKTPFEVAQNSDVVVTMVGYPKDVREVPANYCSILGLNFRVYSRHRHRSIGGINAQY
jgi:3-hydroxyisobutyrate dehydrogenase